MSRAACPRCGRAGCTAWEGFDPEKDAECLLHQIDWQARAYSAEKAVRKILDFMRDRQARRRKSAGIATGATATVAAHNECHEILVVARRLAAMHGVDPVTRSR